MFFEKQYYEEALQEDNKTDTKKYNWCERNLMFKDPTNNRILMLWDFIFFIAVTIESYMVPYVCCRNDLFTQDDITEKNAKNDGAQYYTPATSTIIEDVKSWEIVIDVIWCL